MPKISAENLLLTIAVFITIFVNGSTDAPGCVAGAVAGNFITRRRAVLICALFNFFGMTLGAILFPSVGENINLLSSGTASSLIALITVTLFASGASAFGIPTSESHALIAALGGASLFSVGRVNASFIEITIQSALSCALGFFAGALLCRFMRLSEHIENLFKRKHLAGKVASLCAALSSACHGAQDGQKFIALLPFSAAGSDKRSICASAAVMAGGCLFSGKRIMDRLGSGIVRTPDDVECAAADISAFICTVTSSIFGIPVSTTYMKTFAVLGAAAADGIPSKRDGLLPVILSWILTYPVCMALSYLVCSIYTAISGNPI